MPSVGGERKKEHTSSEDSLELKDGGAKESSLYLKREPAERTDLTFDGHNKRLCFCLTNYTQCILEFLE